jgi:hypothetical protein
MRDVKPGYTTRTANLRHTMHPAQTLWEQHLAVSGYPPGCLPVPAPIPGIAFFPGGYGLYREDTNAPLPPWPKGGIMVLGHDFHSVAGYQASVARGHEDPTQPTWRALTDLLGAARISPRSCFFTNVYMGLRETGTTGRYPGSRSAEFVVACQEFLRRQVEAQAPRLILTLGAWVPAFLGTTFAAVSSWRRARSFRDLDTVGPLIRSAPLTPGLETTVAALVHPSFRAASLRHRTYRGLVGAAAESRLLADAGAS